jgi:hypothetical protein
VIGKAKAYRGDAEKEKKLPLIGIRRSGHRVIGTSENQEPNRKDAKERKGGKRKDQDTRPDAIGLTD